MTPRHFFVTVESVVAVGPEDGVEDENQAKEIARQRLIEWLQKDEAILFVDEEIG